MSNTFTYGIWDDCYFQIGYYPNGNNALQICSESEGPILVVTKNPGVTVPEDKICIKTYSENEGIDDVLISAGIIEPEYDEKIPSGFVSLYIYKLTDKGKKLFNGSDK